jgi:hypothetical protein
MSLPQEFLGLSYDQLKTSKEFSDMRLPDIEIIEDQSYLSVFDKGISFVIPDNKTVGAVQLHSPGNEGFVGYANSLPLGLSFNMDRADVRSVLGDPDRSGEEGEVLFLGKKPAWDSFAQQDFRIHIEYNFGQTTIQMITITGM